MGDEVPSTELARHVPLGADRSPRLDGDVPDPVVRRDEIRDPVVAVVDDDQLALVVVLPEEIPDRLGDEPAPIARRHDAAHQRPARHGRPPGGSTGLSFL